MLPPVRVTLWGQDASERSFTPTHPLDEDDSLELSTKLTPHPFTLRQRQCVVAAPGLPQGSRAVPRA
jgi:hypothetical protein